MRCSQSNPKIENHYLFHLALRLFNLITAIFESTISRSAKYIFKYKVVKTDILRNSLKCKMVIFNKQLIKNEY